MDKKYYKIIGKNIAYYRKQKHLTQEGFAMRANVTRSYISQIEAKNLDLLPSLPMLIHLGEILGIEPYLLLVDTGRYSE